ncbi:MAG: cobalamin-dependent protein [Dehalococcoidia bacterium]|nr:cobalamin-dependent protein [Dehalococcoidia bacterium]
MKILLIQPRGSDLMVGFTLMVRPEPLALEILAAAVPEHEVQILDMRIDQALPETLASFRPDVVGVTGYTTDVPRMLETCAEVKACLPETTTVVGGYHASLKPDDFDKEFVDVIVVGEGEVTFKELCSALENRQSLDAVEGIMYRKNGTPVATPPRPQIADIDQIPLPARHLTDRYRSHYHFHFWDNPALVETARGCPYRCTFCAVWKFHRRKCRVMSAARVLKDLEATDSRVICFVDDNFFQSVRRSRELYKLIKAAGIKKQYWIQARADTVVRYPDMIKEWAEIGLDSALIGFEKINESELDKINKHSSVSMNEAAIRILNENKVDMWGSFIIDPQWTKPDFDALIEYVRNSNICFPLFTILTPLPGTAFFQEKVGEMITKNYEVFDLLHTVLPTKLPLNDFYANMARLYGSTTLGWKGLKDRIRAGRVPVSALERARELLRKVTDPEAYLTGMPSCGDKPVP